MDVAFCLCTVIFIFNMNHASLVFRRCMCTLIVFLIFCNVLFLIFFHPQTFCLSVFNYDVHTCRMDISITNGPYLRRRVFIIHFRVLFVIAFSAFHSIRSRIFHPLQTGAAFSSLAFSIPVFLTVQRFSFSHLQSSQ